MDTKLLKYRCHHIGCDKVFGKASRLVIHERTHTGERPFCCTVESCTKSYARRFHLIKHMSVSHGNPQETFGCEKCEKEFGNIYSLRAHMVNTHNKQNYQCKECKKIFTKAHRLKSHMTEHSGINPYICNFSGCMKKLSGPQELRRHLKSHAKGRYVCSASSCGEKFDIYSSLRRHRAINHKSDLRNGKEESVDPILKHTCPEPGCSKSFGKESRLIVHRRTHTGERPFKCPAELCDSSYTRQFHLNRHLAVAHFINGNPSQEALKCDECGKDLGNIYALKKHQSRIHNIERLTCKDCGQVFRKAQHLKTHSFLHTGVKPYRCDFGGCESRFDVPSKLKRHLATHISNRYCCPYENCKEKFNTYLDLRRHLSYDHPKVCDICGLSFEKLTRLKEHLKCHSEFREVYFCPISPCEKYYFKEANVRFHIKTKHNENYRGFECKVCDKWLITKQKLKLHLQTHDPSYVKPKSRINLKKKRKPRKDKGVQKIDPAELLSGFRDDLMNIDSIDTFCESRNVMSEEIVDSTVSIATHLRDASISDIQKEDMTQVIQSR